ncbi:CAP domain-containing protein (plasmid) [Streptomyces sp. NBC_01717]|uniref:CAP domain-containing protein n=1 Tax=Streptomyces sp. NBC_01717 TaxID=2975918 RepID=UPI002E2F7652|nr:CAP domain-containing protein [Streptomyces sp. NBC_01717]
MSVTSTDGMLLARFRPPLPNPDPLALAHIHRHGGGWALTVLEPTPASGRSGVNRSTNRGGPLDGDPAPRRSFPGQASCGEDLQETLPALLNADRIRYCAPPLALDGRFAIAAQERAVAMAAQGRPGRESPVGISIFQRVKAAGHRAVTVAPHMVRGPRTAAEFASSCQQAAQRWRPAHLDEELVHMGTGHAVEDLRGVVYWTVVWARPFTTQAMAELMIDVLVLTNAERAAAGVAPLLADLRLTEAAQAHSTDMVVRVFYSHTCPEGREPRHRAAAAGWPHPVVGENIACGQRSPVEVVRGWMDSPAHRANILNPTFTHVGIGYAVGGLAGGYWTQLFGTSA